MKNKNRKGIKALIHKNNNGYWGTIKRFYTEDNLIDYFCYDTSCFDTLRELKNELKSFCKFKNLRIVKYIMENC